MVTTVTVDHPLDGSISRVLLLAQIGPYRQSYDVERAPGPALCGTFTDFEMALFFHVHRIRSERHDFSSLKCRDGTGHVPRCTSEEEDEEVRPANSHLHLASEGANCAKHC
jgi:hypothetical protein